MHSQRRRYSAYGIGLISDIALPFSSKRWTRSNCTPQDSVSDDVFLTIGDSVSDDQGISPTTPPSTVIEDTGFQAHIDSSSTRVDVYKSPNGTSQDLIDFIRCPVLTYLVSARGSLCLHASAVTRGRDVFVFLGPSGVGKSSMAMALQQQGVPVFADDLVVARLCHERAQVALEVYSGGRTVRLHPGTAEFFGVSNWSNRFGSAARMVKGKIECDDPNSEAFVPTGSDQTYVLRHIFLLHRPDEHLPMRFSAADLYVRLAAQVFRPHASDAWLSAGAHRLLNTVITNGYVSPLRLPSSLNGVPAFAKDLHHRIDSVARSMRSIDTEALRSCG